MLQPGDLLVFNDTRVTALRLRGRRDTGGAVEAVLLRETERPGSFVALVRPARRLRPGAVVTFEGGLCASVGPAPESTLRTLDFGTGGEVRTALAEQGRVPLPPYIIREIDEPERYQTVFAREPGSAAAPTAGLHFTPELLAAIESRGVARAWVTLDVGLDTFRPIATEDVTEHRMHGERCCVPDETAQAVARCAGRMIAVGTTAVRTLETFAIGPRRIESGERVTHLFITPGHGFRCVDGIVTNFHMPRSTLLLLMAAFVGRDTLMRAYAEALRHEYRFLSFGDAMLTI